MVNNHKAIIMRDKIILIHTRVLEKKQNKVEYEYNKYLDKIMFFFYLVIKFKV